MSAAVGRRRPVCRDYLKGVCSRIALCKYRHLTLDQYTDELLRTPPEQHNDAGALEDRLRLVEAENAALRQRVSVLNQQLRRHRQLAADEFRLDDSSTLPTDKIAGV